MKKSRSPLSGAVRLTQYSELREYAEAFGQGHLRTVYLIGPPGVGKSRVLRDSVGSNALWIDGSASPFGIYCAAFEHLNQPIILDDVDGLVGDRKGTRMLKSLCQTDATKHVSWESDSRALAQRGIPRSFETTSQVALICNSWASSNPDVAAVGDRAHLLLFEPAALEVHRAAAAWFQDQEIFDFVGQHLGLVAEHSFRTYVLAREMKAAGKDWRLSVLSRFLTGAALAVARLQTNPAYATTADKVRAFVTAGHGRRSTYFNQLRRLPLSDAAPEIRLLQPESPAACFSNRPSWSSPRALIRD
jgi:hypothetical protein